VRRLIANAHREVFTLISLACCAAAFAPAAAAQRRSVDFGVGVDAAADEALRLPGRIVIAPPVDSGPLRDMTVEIEATTTVRYSSAGWPLSVAPITIAASRPLVSGGALLTAVGATTTLDGATGARHMAEVSTWFGGEAHDVWIRAALEQDETGGASRTVEGAVSRTLHPRLAAFADFAFTASAMGSWRRLSHGVVYHAAPGRSIDMSCRHETAAAPTCSLTFAVVLGGGR